MKKILICEDEKDLQKIFKFALLKEKHKLYSAEDGQKAIDAAKKIKPDLILLDIRMPKIDGLEAAKEIRKFDKQTKIIFLTAFEGPEILKEASKYDIYEYIVKTAPLEKIMATIQGALEK